MTPPEVGILRRLASATYDGLLLLAVLMLLTALLQIATHGAAITHANVGAWEYAYRALLGLAVVLYFGLCWRTRRGQTLGMKAWHIRLETASGATPGWRRVAARLACAAPLYLLAIGGVLLFMAHRLAALPTLATFVPLLLSLGWARMTGGGTLDDRVSGTRLVRAPTVPPDR